MLQTTQAAIPENEQAALTAILEFSDPDKLQAWSQIDENSCTLEQLTCDEQQSHITSINLSRLGLTQLAPDIGQFTALEDLDLSVNELDILPAEIGQLANLRWMYLQENQLRSLPAEIVELSNLNVLNLSSNQLTDLPQQLGQSLNLQSLILNDNLLSSLPESLTQALGGINPFCGLECSRVSLVLTLQDNCLTEAALSTSLINWLKSDAIDASSNVSEALLIQHDICAQQAPLLIFTSERSEHSEQIDFINTDATNQPVPTANSVAYTLYPVGQANRANSALSTGETTLAGNTWRIDTEELPEGNYEVVFWAENDLYATGIQAWSHSFVKAYEESSIAASFELTPSFAVNSSADFPALSPALNLDHALFSGATPLIYQLGQIPGLAILHRNTERIYWKNESGLYISVRPFMIKKTDADTGSEMHVNADGLIELTTDYQRIITAAPAIANLTAFKIALSTIDLSLDKISATGVIQTKTSNTSSNTVFYSARADFQSAPAHPIYTVPGLYFFATAHDLVNVPMANHVYTNDQEQTLQQTVYATPFDWLGLKAELQAQGYSKLSLAYDGVISGEINNQQYHAYMDYKVTRVQRSRHTQNGLKPVTDLNGDGHLDMQIILSDPDYPEGYGLKQIMYVFPAE